MIFKSLPLFKAIAFCARISPQKVREFLGYNLASQFQINQKVKQEVSPKVFLDLDLGDWLQRLYYCGLTGPWTLRLLKKFVPAGGTFVDVGANVGLYTCVMANHIGPSGFVMAFEPMQENYAQLCYNTKINNLRNVDTQALALSDRITEFALYLPMIHPGGPSGATRLSNPGDWKKVGTATSTTLDRVFRRNRFDFIKIDVEGHELEVLEGAKNTIQRFRPKMLCEVHRSNFKKFFEFVSQWEYTVLNKDEKGNLEVSSSDIPEKIGWRDFFLIAKSEFEYDKRID